MKNYIIYNATITSNSKYLLRLDRSCNILEVYTKADSCEKAREYFPLREDFDLSGHTVFEISKRFSCIIGGAGTKATPCGTFAVVDKRNDEYESPYYEGSEHVYFYGYLKVFEDYFIHSDIYAQKTNLADINNGLSTSIIGNDDNFTSGCVRVSQSDLAWLLENIDIGSVVIL